LNKILICSAVAAALSANAQAEKHNKDNEKWVAGFVEYYSTDKAETGLPNFLDNGYGAGAEYGFKFTPGWAIRLEISKLDIDASPSDESGSRFGVDALYFMPNDLFYTFGGLKFTEINETDLMANIGLGKHWDLGNSLKIITEVAAYQTLDSGDSNTHFGYKLGLAYAFGGSTVQAIHRDGDNDGVMDEQDKCLFTPAGIKVDVSGCELPQVTVKVKDQDQDQDNVLDEQDKCSDTPILDKVDADGCSLFTQEQYSTNLKVLFANNSSTIRNPDSSQFQEFSDFMSRFPSTDAVVEGHSSAIGEYAYNMWLSQARADAVRTLLINEYGISEVRLTAQGLGESQLLDNSNTAAANMVNRRTVVTVKATTREKVAR
jgi:OOP family OmpA-OmpF porin